MNDMQAHAMGCLVARENKVHCLQEGKQHEANYAVIAPGTGLGEALIIRDGKRLIPALAKVDIPAFAPTTTQEVALLQFAWKKFEHVSCERVISGSLGLPLLLEFMLQDPELKIDVKTFWQNKLLRNDVGAEIGRVLPLVTMLPLE